MLRKSFVVVLTGAVAAGAGAIFALQPADAALPGGAGKIIYTTGQSGFVLAAADGSTHQAVTPAGTAATGRAEFAPDGSEIAFASGGSLYLSEPDGSRVFKATTGTADASPAWSRFGSWMMFSRPLGDHSQLYGGDANELNDTSKEGGPSAIFSADTGSDDLQPDIAADASFAFVRKTGNASAIWLVPTQQSYPVAVTAAKKLVDDATEPSFSPDAKKLAFVRTVDGHAQLFTVAVDGTGLTQLTTDAFDHATPAWSPDGAKIAYSKKTETGDTEVYVRPVAGGDEVQVSGADTTGDRLPHWAPVVTDTVQRSAGANRIETAIRISQSVWGNVGQASTDQAKVAVLARSDNFPDALSGGPLAARKQGPLLLTPTNGLPANVAGELRRVLPKGSTVYVLGGAGAISPAVAGRVTSLGYKVKRLSGANRFSTALAVANELGTPTVVLLATGQNFPDALSAGAAAGSFNGIVLLTNDGALPTSVNNYLLAHYKKLDLLGAVGTQADTALRRAGWSNYYTAVGKNRYQTSLLVAKMFAGSYYVGVATGTGYPDAVAGGAALGWLGGPLLLTPKDGLPAGIADYLGVRSGHISQADIFGGTSVVSQNVQTQVAGLIGTSVEQTAASAGGAHSARQPVGAQSSRTGTAGAAHSGLAGPRTVHPAHHSATR